MAWNRAGTVTVTNGSAVVTGNGTNFSFPNAQPGQAFIGPNGLPLEILSVDSATQLTLAVPYTGATANGQPFAILPTASFANDLALAFSGFKNTYGVMLDTIGQGMFADGSPAAPGLRFTADQDTGIRRYGENGISIVAGGVDRLAVDSSGGAVYGRLAVTAPNSEVLRLLNNGAPGTRIIFADTIASAEIEHNSGTLRFKYAGAIEGFRLDATGNLLVGVVAASNHVISRGTNEGDLVMQVQGKAHPGVAFFSAASGSASGSACAFALNKNSQTNRSINAAGTINGSGADYAEYMLKAAGCGIIAKGDVCGVDRDGKLTRTGADAISFVVKSTDPSLVGGDTWAAHLSPRPGQEEGETDEAFATREAEWSAALEQARLSVDRIAFCGQVPCNVTGNFEVGDYIVAVASGAGIKAVAVKPDAITLPQYMSRIGKVWAIRDGRAWIDVQHG